MAQMNCGKDKAVKLFKTLDTVSGIGLIERKKQGQGRPTRIYVKNFVLPSESDMPPGPSDPQPCQDEESSTTEIAKGQPMQEQITLTSENQKSALRHSADLQTSAKPKSGGRKSRSQDFGKTDANKTNKNNTEKNDTEIPSIHQSPSLPKRPRKPKVQPCQHTH